MVWRIRQLGKMVSAKQYILFAIAVGIGFCFLVWWLMNEPIPQTIPDRSLKI